MALKLVHVMNTITSAVTTFDGYPFDSYAEIGGKYYGAGPDGMYLLDAPPPAPPLPDSVPFVFTTGDFDYGLSVLKRMSDFYIAMRSDGDVTLRVWVDELLIGEYVLSPLDIETLKQRRSLIGKGARGRYWRFELSGDAPFDFDAYNTLVVPVSRRV